MDTNLGRVIGYDGKEIELSRDSLYIKWRYVGDTNWKNLISLNDLKVGLPKGGTTNQVLTKLSNNDWDYIWKTPEGGGGSVDDGVYHPKNGDELYDIFENEPGWAKIIDFSNFDYSTFYKDGYIIDGKSFTIRNFSMGSDWGARQFNWLKSPLFTLNNGATLYFQKLVIDISNVHHDAGDGQEAANNAPVIRVNNGSYVSIVDGGMININNVTGIDKYVAIELNNSNTNIQNFGIIINSYDMRRPSGIDSLTCGILCNGFSYGENNFDRVGFEINGNTTEKYGIKYNDDLGGFIKIHGCNFIVDDGNGYSIYCSNKTILELNFANVGKIDGMAITVKQLSPDTDYYKDDIIEINNKLYQVTQDFNSNDYNDIEDGYGQVYEDFWTINVTGTMYSIEDPNGRISSYETTDDGYRAKGLTLDTENWNLPISDQNLTSDNAQDAIKELASRESGGGFANLYDTKLLSQAIADKGWAFQGYSTRQDLSKDDIPTVYEDIKMKYDNCDSAPSSSFTTLLNNAIPTGMFAIDDTHIYATTDRTSSPVYLKRTLLSSFPGINWENTGIPVGWGGFKPIAVGDKLLIVRGYRSGGGNVNINIYNKSDCSLIKTITTKPGTDNDIIHILTIGGKKVFFLVYQIENNNIVLSKIEDDLLANEVILRDDLSSVIGQPAYDEVNDTYWFYYSGNSKICKTTDNFATFIEVTNHGHGYYPQQPPSTFIKGETILVTSTNNGVTAKVSLDSGQTWDYVRMNSNTLPINALPYFDGEIMYCQFRYNNKGNIYTTTDLHNFTFFAETLNDGGYSNGLLIYVPQKDTLFTNLGQSRNSVDYLGIVKTVYTDTYTIGSSSINVDYYKYGSFKICVKDGGTNDANIDTVYNALGYENYFVIDDTNETLALPRNSNLWTMMYVGDDYEDSNLPTGNYSAVALKSEIEKLPDQTGQNGKYLKTNGTSTSWQDIELPSSMLQEAATVALTGDYSDLSNKPSINNITLSGNKSANDLGLQNQLTWTYTEATETLEVE